MDNKLKKLVAAYAKASDRKARKLLEKSKTAEEFLVCALTFENADFRSGSVAAEAAMKINDRNMLFAVATQARDGRARIKIAQTSTDTELLKAIRDYSGSKEYIMTNTQQWAVERLRELAMLRIKDITDETALEAMVLGTKLPDVYDEILRKITSTERLISIAVNAPLWQIRKAAYRRIRFDSYQLASDHEETLCEGIINEKESRVECSDNLRLITDDVLLKRVVRKAKLFEARLDAFRAVTETDDAFIVEVLRKFKLEDFDTITPATRQITRSYYDFQSSVLNRTKSVGLLISFAKETHPDWLFRQGDVKQTTDTSHWSFRLKSLEKLFSITKKSGDAKLNAQCDEIVLALLNEAETSTCYGPNELRSKICLAIPETLWGKYGFTARKAESEAEDEYGRHTAHHLYITFQGHEYRVY